VPDFRTVRTPLAANGRRLVLRWAGILVLSLVGTAHAQDPARTATIFVPGFEITGALRDATFGIDINNKLADSIATLAGLAVADGATALPPSVVAVTHYYGDTAPPYYTQADRTELNQVTLQWGGGVPRYALIIAKYIRNVMARSGAQQVNIVSGSFGSLITRWMIEKDIGGLASQGRIARWLSIEGLIAGNWEATDGGNLLDIVLALDPDPIDIQHMNYGWVETYLHAPRTQADNAFYGRMLLGEVASDDDGYNGAALTNLMRNVGAWQPNDGVQAMADAQFHEVTARSQFLGRLPTYAVRRDEHLGILHDHGAWAEAATFVSQRRRVTVTMTSATVADLLEPQSFFWDWRPAEVVLESRVYSPEVQKRWGITDPLTIQEKEGAAAPLRRYWHNGETQTFQYNVFDDFVLDTEKELRVDLHAEEIDYDWRYGVHETITQPYYDEMGLGSVTVSTLHPGNYTFQAADWKCTLSVSVMDYPFGAPLDVPGSSPAIPNSSLRVSPNPSSADVRIALDDVEPASLEVRDLSGRLVRRMSGAGEFAWDGRGDDGTRVPAGLYFYRVTTARGVSTGRSVRVR
jgi:hypothetical protein